MPGQKVNIKQRQSSLVRNTAIQTLFRSIQMTFGPLWQERDWQEAWTTILSSAMTLEPVDHEMQVTRNLSLLCVDVVVEWCQQVVDGIQAIDYFK